jgi:hypothetical protein
MPDGTLHLKNIVVQSFGASTTKKSSPALSGFVLRHWAHDQFFADLGGGSYNLSTFLDDAATVIAHNHASDSNDDCFGC